MGLVGVMFFVTGTGYNALQRFRNDGKVSTSRRSACDHDELVIDSAILRALHPHSRPAANPPQHR